MKNNLAKLFAVSSIVAGGSLMAAMPANAVLIDLADGDFLNVTSYGARFTGTPGFEGVINALEFDDDPTLGIDFIPGGSFATADLTSTSIAPLIAADPTGEGVVKIKSLDFTAAIVSGAFTLLDPVDFDFDPEVSNRFSVDSSIFGNFVEVDSAIDAETPDLAIELVEFTTFQSSSLLEDDAVIGVGLEGDVIFKTFSLDGEEITLGTGSFSTTFPANGTPEVLGTAVFSFETEVQVPESSNVFALIGLGLLGSACALKKKAK